MAEKDYRDEQIARLSNKIRTAFLHLVSPGDPVMRIEMARAVLELPARPSEVTYTSSVEDLPDTERVSLAQVSRAVMDSIEEAMSEPSAERARILIDSARIYADLANALAIARGDDA